MNLKKRGRPFRPGNRFGKGRPAGSRNKVTLECEALLEGEALAITRKVIALAKKGNLPAAKLCMDRLCPPRRERRLHLELPEMASAEDIRRGLQVLMQELAEGRITPGEAERVAHLLDCARKSIETQVLEGRLAEVEKTIREYGEAHERRAA